MWVSEANFGSCKYEESGNSAFQMSSRKAITNSVKKKINVDEATH